MNKTITIKNNKFLLTTITAAVLVFIVLFSMNEIKKSQDSKKSTSNIVSNSNVSNSALSAADKAKIIQSGYTIPETKYDDGRVSEARSIDPYSPRTDPEVNKNEPIKLLGTVVEWNKYEALVSSEETGFIQLETNTMRGGDVQTNKRVSKSLLPFFKQSKKIFQERMGTLLKVDKIPNRNVDSVSFDFITNKGTYTVQESKKTLESGDTDLSRMFKEAKKLNLEIKNADTIIYERQ